MDSDLGSSVGKYFKHQKGRTCVMYTQHVINVVCIVIFW